MFTNLLDSWCKRKNSFAGHGHSYNSLLVFYHFAVSVYLCATNSLIVNIIVKHQRKSLLLHALYNREGGSVAEWLACWTQAQKGLGSNRSRDAVG